MNNTRITTSFGEQSTAAEVIDGIDLSGRRAIVTGGSSGIGVETARALASAHAEVTLAVRNETAGARSAAEIIASSGNKRVSVAPLELADQTSIAAFVAKWDGPLHILVNNAGIMAAPLSRTVEGWELQFATNHLGHFALATGLHDALALADGARIVSVSSAGHLNSAVVFDDIHYERRAYDPWKAYGQSKTANILFAVEATKRWASDQITVNALMPGRIHTNLARHVDEAELARALASVNSTATALRWKTIEQGAATSVLLASAPLLAGIGGRYFEDCNEAGLNLPGTRIGFAPYAVDPDIAARLWQVSLDTLG